MKKLLLIVVLVLLRTENALAVSFTLGPTQTLLTAVGMVGIIDGYYYDDIVADSSGVYLVSDDLSEFNVILNLEITAYSNGPVEFFYNVFGQNMQTGGWSSYDKLNVSVPLVSQGGKAWLPGDPWIDVLEYWWWMKPEEYYFCQASLTISSYSVEGFPAVPEPSTMLLLGTGILGLVGLNKRRRK